MKTYRVADLFCGAGGSSTGALRAIRDMGGELDLVAVNHWDVAIATHSRNHPGARHHCVNLDAARPEDIVPEGYLDLLMASPECTYHSRARGGKPINDQLRMSAWHVQRWVIRRWPAELAALLHEEADRVEHGAWYVQAVGVVTERFNEEGQGD